MKVGTRVLAEGPFGVFTSDTRTRDKVLLIAGGIGITPVRALLEEFRRRRDHGLPRAHRADLVFATRSTSSPATRRQGRLHRRRPRDPRRAAPAHPRASHELVPDIDEREIYLCGPPAMIALIERTLHRSNLHGRHVHIERFAI